MYFCTLLYISIGILLLNYHTQNTDKVDAKSTECYCWDFNHFQLNILENQIISEFNLKNKTYGNNSRKQVIYSELI